MNKPTTTRRPKAAVAAKIALPTLAKGEIYVGGTIDVSGRVADIISTNPLIQSLLYDIDLLPEQIKDKRRYGYMLAVIDHMLVFASRVAAQREEK